VNEHTRKVIRAAARLGVPVVNTFVGRDKDRTHAENMAEFEKVWPPIVEEAESLGVKVAIENCPMIFSADEWPGGVNLAYSPAIWRELSISPAVLRSASTEPPGVADDRLRARGLATSGTDLHAPKDLGIAATACAEHGVMSLGMGWQVPRLRLGGVRWDRFLGACRRLRRNIVIEHEDRRFEGMGSSCPWVPPPRDDL
jgi:hypothetical protein